MKRRNKIMMGLAAVVATAVGSFAIALSYSAPCQRASAQSSPPGVEQMKAVVARCYGGPEVLAIEQVAIPAPVDDQVLVRVHTAAANPADWRSMRGEPYFIRLPDAFGAPKDPFLGVDFAGTVVAVGERVTRFKPGDEVFGGGWSAFAEYTIARDWRIAHKPPTLSFEDAAAVPVAAITALQGLRDHGRIRPGSKVLINGASGGVGTFAVQIAKAFGAEVTGVCSTRNLELVRSLGADRVIDYTRQDFASSDEQYDLILDNVGNRSLKDYRRVLKPDGALVIVGASSHDPWIGPVWLPIKAAIASRFVDQHLGLFIASIEGEDLETLSELIQAGKVKPVIDRTYTLGQISEAIAYLETSRARGKVLVSVNADAVDAGYAGMAEN